MLHRLFTLLPALCILLAAAFYFVAASLYSRATANDPAARGYRHLHNYWCELYNDITYTGAANPGRPWAMAATLLIVFALLVFWFTITALFPDRPRLARTIRLTGGLGFAFASLIFTPLHDLVIYIGVPLGAIALLATCLALAQKRYYVLLTLALLAATMSLFDYLVWTLGLLHPMQPFLQKTAFLLFFVWVLMSSVRLLTLPRLVQLDDDASL